MIYRLNQIFPICGLKEMAHSALQVVGPHKVCLDKKDYQRLSVAKKLIVAFCSFTVI